MTVKQRFILISLLLATFSVLSQDRDWSYSYLGREFAKKIKKDQKAYYYDDYNGNSEIPKDSIHELLLTNTKSIFKIVPSINELKKFKNIEILNVQGNEGFSILEIVSAFPTIKELNIYHIYGVNLDSLFFLLSKCKELKSLRISNSDIRYISKNIQLLNHLERLEFTNMQIEFIPPEFSALQNLKYLNLSNTGMYRFLIDYKNVNLKYLDISDNRLNGLPIGIQYLEGLECFRFIGNKYYSTDDTILCKNVNMQFLFLDECGMEHFPMGLSCMPSLKNLFIGDNRIMEVPKTLSEFKELRYIDWQGFAGDRDELNALKKKFANITISTLPSTIDLEPIIDIF